MHLAIAAPVSLRSFRGDIPGYRPETDGLGSPIITNLAKELHRRGHDLTIVSLSPHEADAGSWYGERLSLHVGRYRREYRARDAFRAERRDITRLLRSSDPNLVHAHWTYEFALGAMTAHSSHLVTVRDWAPEILRFHRHPYWLVRLGMQRRVLRRAGALTANSPYIAQRIERDFGRTVPVIPNGIVLRDGMPPVQRRESLRIGALNTGFSRRKNVAQLIRAFAAARPKAPELTLHLAGSDFEPSGPAEVWARRHGLHEGVEFVGPIKSTDVPAFMRSLALFVHPSLEESFGMVLLEAIDEGTPVIAGRDSGAVPWVLGEGAAGCLLDVRNADAITRAILELLDDHGARESMAVAAWKHVRERFGLSAVVDLYEEQYDALLGRGAHNGGSR